MEHQPAAGGSGVNVLLHRFEAHSPDLQFTDGLDQVRQRPTQPVQPPHHQRVPRPQLIEHRRQLRTVGPGTAGGVRPDPGTPSKDAGRFEEAVAGYEGLLPDLLRVLGPDAPYTLNTRNNLASAYRDAGRLEEAITGFEGLLPDLLRVLGGGARLTLSVRYNLALAYYYAGGVQEAITRFEQLLPDVRRVLGVEDHLTSNTRARLVEGYRAVGRHEDADHLLDADE